MPRVITTPPTAATACSAMCGEAGRHLPQRSAPKLLSVNQLPQSRLSILLVDDVSVSGRTLAGLVRA